MRSDFRRLSPTRSRASGTPGAISTSGTSPKSSIFALEKDGLGFQVFNATNDEGIANEPTMSFLTKNAPQTAEEARTGGVRGTDVQSEGARAFLGFRELHNWRRHAPNS